MSKTNSNIVISTYLLNTGKSFLLLLFFIMTSVLHDKYIWYKDVLSSCKKEILMHWLHFALSNENYFAYDFFFPSEKINMQILIQRFSCSSVNPKSCILDSSDYFLTFLIDNTLLVRHVDHRKSQVSI